MADIFVYIWIKNSWYNNPIKKGSYGHAALQIPSNGEEQPQSLYISFYPNEQFRGLQENIDYYNAADHRRYKFKITITDAQLNKIYAALHKQFGNNFSSNTINDVGNLRKPQLIGARRSSFFQALISPFTGRRNQNCTSLVVLSLKAAGIKIPIDKLQAAAVITLNILNGGMGGYSIGVLSDLCHQCTEDAKNAEEIADKLSYSWFISALVFMSFGFVLYCFTPNILTSRFNLNLLVGFFLFLLSTGIFVSTAYYHSIAETFLDSTTATRLGAGLGAGLGLSLLIELYALWADTQNYLIRPNGLRKILTGLAASEDNITRIENGVSEAPATEEDPLLDETSSSKYSR